MKEGFVLKAKQDAESGDLEKINRYTRREFKADEIYTFSVVLCDNEIDRDGERFTPEALQKLSVLFLGKTGIFNHSMQAQNQTARIYDCSVERDETRRTKCGEAYCRLVAKAYLPNSEKNRDFILELESGIKKEVSVGCSVASVRCSICGADLKHGTCTHVKGREYGGKVCCAVLDEPTDAYEWSFVAIPAQREAGVIKSFSGWEEIEKSLTGVSGDVTLTKAQSRVLLERLNQLEAEAECGRAYRAELVNSFVKCASVAQPGIPAQALRRTAEAMDLDDLKTFEKAYRRQANELLPLSPQLAVSVRPEQTGANAQFKI